MNFESTLQHRLQQRQKDSLYRSRNILESAQDVEIVLNGQRLINFCSNDYLGLANHPKIISALKKGADLYGVGSGSAHLVSGHFAVHHELEQTLAEYVSRPRALLFSTGYMANLGIASALLSRHDTILLDHSNHASLIDAGLLSAAKFRRFRHNDVNSLKQQLQASVDSNLKLIVADGVFSMDGDQFDLKKFIPVAKQHNAVIMIDDAHGLGVTGATGRGTLEHFNATINDVPILMATLGKALGTFGAFVAGSEQLIETLIQQSRSYIYTTALPPALAYASLASLKIVSTDSEQRQRLQQRITQFKSAARELGLNLLPSDTPIQPLIIGSSRAAMTISSRLKQAGFLISAIRPPTVTKNTSRLRITLSANHSQLHIEKLLTALESMLPELNSNVR